MTEWQPIETAPLHTEVLVYREDAGVLLAKKTCLADWLITENDTDHGMTEDELWENQWFSYDDRGASRLSDDHVRGKCDGNPTHWMPLPEAPK